MSKRILIIKLGAFGDIILADGAMHDIRLHHAGDEITVLTGPAYKKIFERCPWVDKILLDPRDPRWRIDLMYRLNQRVDFDSFDMIYDLQWVRRTNFYYSWFVKRASWSGIAAGCSHSFQLPSSKSLTRQEEYDIQLRAAGVETKYTTAPDLSWFVEDASSKLQQAGVSKHYIVLIAGASARHPQKCWPYYKKLAELLINDGFCVVTAPGPTDLELCRPMPGIMLTGDGEYLDFFQLAGVLQGAAFVIGNDSGPTHLAAHLGVPGLALFGGNSTQYMRSMRRRKFECVEKDRLADLSAEEVLSKIKQSTRLAC